MKPQKVILFDKAGSDEDIKALSRRCPVCGSEVGRFCGMLASRGSSRARDPAIMFIHARRAVR